MYVGLSNVSTVRLHRRPESVRGVPFHLRKGTLLLTRLLTHFRVHQATGLVFRPLGLFYAESWDLCEGGLGETGSVGGDNICVTGGLGKTGSVEGGNTRICVIGGLGETGSVGGAISV